MPPVDLAGGGLLLPAVRGLAVIALYFVFGTLVFLAIVAPRAFVKAPPEQIAETERLLSRLIRASLVAAAAAMIGWLVLEAIQMAGATDPEETWSALLTVLWQTSFGHTIVLQLAALLATGLGLGRGGSLRRRQAAGLPAGVAILLQAGHSHAFSMEGREAWLLLPVAVHLLAGGAWLGGLPPLLLTIRTMPPAIGAAACRWFSPLGKFCLATVSVSAAVQGYVLAGGFTGLVGSAYGWVALIKLLLLAVLTLFAVINRYRLAPALMGTNPASAKRVILRAVAWQTAAGVLVVLAAGLLGSLPPGMHLQPVWPFAEQFSLVTVREDADFRNEVIGALVALAGALVLLALGAAIRRVRWASLALAAPIAWFAIPHLSLLLVPAYPTSLYRSPTAFSATSIADGAALYPVHCAGCHGAEGRGDGVAAIGLPVPPADLTAPHLWAHSDGELFWWLSEGMAAPDGAPAMPGFRNSLTDDQLWHLIDYIRAHNAGIHHAESGGWSPPIKAPELWASCAGKEGVILADRQGTVSRIILGAGADDAPPPPGGTPMTTILVPGLKTPLSEHAPGLCIASDPAIRTAYGVITANPPDALDGILFLVDPNGWLRDERQITDPPPFSEIQEIYSHPIDRGSAAPAHHHAS